MDPTPEPVVRDRERDRRGLVFVLGLIVAAAALARLQSRSITGHYAPAAAAARLDVNAASVDALAALPAVGPTLAARVVAERDRHGRFADLEELVRRIDGLGPDAARALAAAVTFGE